MEEELKEQEEGIWMKMFNFASCLKQYEITFSILQ